MTPLSERDFQAQICQLAELCGFEWMHIRSARTVDSWRTPVSGTMGAGFPDLLLVHPGKRRLLFIEVKAEAGKTTAHQERVLNVLRSIEHYPTPIDVWLRQKPPIAHPSIQVFVWRPSDWDFIQATLSERRAA